MAEEKGLLCAVLLLGSLAPPCFRPSLHRSMSTAIHHHVLRSVSLSIHPCICPSTSSSSHPSIYLATHAFIWSSTLLVIFRSSDLCVHLSIHLPSTMHLFIRQVLSPPVLRSTSWPVDQSVKPPRRQQTNAARLLLATSKTKQFCETFSHFLQFKTSKTKQFCETYSHFFAVENIKNEAILRDFLQKWKVDCTADGLVPMRFAIFPCRVSKVLRLPRKS